MTRSDQSHHSGRVLTEGERLLANCREAPERWALVQEHRHVEYEQLIQQLVKAGRLTRTKLSFVGTKVPDPTKVRAFLAQAEAEQVIAEGTKLLKNCGGSEAK
jgi:hypothetical protein